MTAQYLALPLLLWLTVHPAAAQTSTPAGGVLPTTDRSPESVVAEPTNDARQQARQRFETGMKLYEEGDYALALLEFERAHTLVPGHRVLYNIGQVNIQLGRYARATRKLRQYLAEGGDQIPDDRRASVLADLDMLAGRTATLMVSINVAGAEIVLGNDIIAVSPMPAPVLVDAGEHRLTTRKPGYLEQIRPLALAGRDQISLELALTEAPRIIPVEKTVVVERPASPEVSEDVARRHLALTLGWTGTGLLAAAWAVTGYMGINTATERKDLLGEATSAAELASLKQRTRNWYIAADVCGGLTLATATTMLYYTLFAPRPTMVRRITLGISPESILVTGQF